MSDHRDATAVGLTVQQAAQWAGVPAERIRRWVRDGVLTNYGSPGRVLVSRLELERHMGAEGAAVDLEALRRAIEPIVRAAVRAELRAAFSRLGQGT